MADWGEVRFYVQRSESLFRDWVFDVIVQDDDLSEKFRFTTITGGPLVLDEKSYGVLRLNLPLAETDLLILTAKQLVGARKLFATAACSPLLGPQFYIVLPKFSPGSRAVAVASGSESQGQVIAVKASEAAKIRAGLPFIMGGEATVGAEQSYTFPTEKATGGTSVTDTSPTQQLDSFTMERTLARPSMEGMLSAGQQAFG